MGKKKEKIKELKRKLKEERKRNELRDRAREYGLYDDEMPIRDSVRNGFGTISGIAQIASLFTTGIKEAIMDELDHEREMYRRKYK